MVLNEYNGKLWTNGCSNSNQCTPLTRALYEYRDLRMVKILIAAGAQDDIFCHNNKEAFQWIKEKEHLNIVKYLRNEYYS